MVKNCFCSWSGGKDSCLALYRAMADGYQPKKLLTMFSMENDISSAHRLKEGVIKAQAEALGIESCIGRALFHEYEEVFVNTLKAFKEEGIPFGVFGDIDLDPNREWEERVCNKAGMTALLPLWQQDRKTLVQDFIDLGFKAKIVVVNKDMLDPHFLGQDLSIALMAEIEAHGADVCGENGEYHTIVYDGPIFKHPIQLTVGSEVIPVGASWAQIDVGINDQLG